MSRKPLDRRALFASGAAAALLAATGLSAATLPRRGGKLRLALSGATRSDTWMKGNGLFMQVARLGLAYETLTEVAADRTLRSALAMGWSSSADARVWSFDLRTDAYFHDGTLCTPLDAVYSLAALGDVRMTGKSRIEIVLNEPDPALPFTVSAIEHIIRPAHAPGSGIGTGLYRITRFAQGQQVLADRVGVHWKDGQAGWFDRVELVSVPSDTVRAQAVAEYLVDGADVADHAILDGYNDIAVWDGQAISRSVAMPVALGRGIFDDLRAPQRWWGA
jgi:ABC-type transport system substrate-binding protein